MPIVALDQISRDQVHLAGGKGANLGELIANGFPVPPGFVVSAQEYAAFMTSFDIPLNDEMPVDSMSYLRGLRQRILDAELPEDLSTSIQSAHQDLLRQRSSDIVYAIRSSATAEDLGDASFAGQHDTYYYVTSAELDLMTKKCWASLWSDAAFSYRQSQGIEHRSVSMAVVVQEMVPSDISGVTFTADPVSGSESVIITESSWGMGAAIVDGRVSPDQYVVEKRRLRLTSIKISDKKFMVPASIEAGQHSRLLEVPPDLRNKETLDDAQIEQIAALAVKSEKHFGCAQDIEWAIHNGELFFLQSRPITVIGSQEPDIPPGSYVLFKPMAENFTDPLMPLSIDMLADLLPMMTIIHGRAYVPLKLIRGLLPFKMTDEDVARAGYLSEPEESSPRVSTPRLLVLFIVLAFNYLMMAVFNRRTADMPDDFMASFRAFCDKVVEDDSISAQDTLVHVFARFRFFEPAGNMVLLANLVAPRYMILLQVLSGLIKRWCPGLPSDAASLLCSGSKGVLSTDMGREILDLAHTARQSEEVRQVLTEVPLTEALKTLARHESANTFLNQLNAFLAKHGHRALKEFEFSSTRWDEDPSLVLGMVRNYLLVDTDLADTESGVKKHRAEMKIRLEENLKGKTLEWLGRPRLRLINSLIAKTKYYMKLRENSRFYHIMGFYAVRKKILKLEASLLQRSLLKCKDDIFYLHWQEVKQLDSGELAWSDVEETMRARRMEFIRQSKITPPKTIGIDIDPPVPEGSQSLSGQGASPGRYEGIARVIMDPATDSEIKPGEILVAPYTDPAWTPLFLTANAAVVEVGSYLSHAGTIAREYGMPCVVDVANCTSRIKTGTRIIVDGSQGSITLVEEQVVEEQVVDEGNDHA